MAKLGFVGLGSMARPIVRNLMAAGNDVIVWNRSPARVQGLAADGAIPAANAKDVNKAPVVFSMLSDDRAVRETLLVDDFLATVTEGSIHINLSTISPALAGEAASIFASRGANYLASPVFGRVAVAEAGKLNIITGGPSDLVNVVEPYLNAIGTKVWRMGERPEQANTVKIIGNYLIACAIQSLSEAVSLAEAQGIDASTLIDLFSSTLFPGSIYKSYGEIIAERKYKPAGFTTVLGKKDVMLALDTAHGSDVPLPIGNLLRDVFDAALQAGHAEDDWASIAEMQPRRSN